ncbi:UNVERIFIED_CONTAM: hypothetical protein Sradi_4310600 [Sesamum radiatum]|uniref:Uncharacterized protein n=1 Tax=Sesamum radiatum TaxID=300843 RepID=A0AAW2NNH2_SESRA
MPQVDLETLVSACAGGGNDRKIACETLAGGGADDDAPKNDVIPGDYAGVDPDFPPESFWLSKDAEYDWFDRNAFYERKDSTKGNSNSNSTNLSQSINPSSNSNSQRFSVKSKASIIGLPKTQKATFVDSKRRTCKSANIRLFPKRSGSAGKSAVPVAEPGSPKVSCMGRVRSKRGRRRSKKGHRKPPRSGSRKTAEVLEEEPVVVEPQRESVSPKARGIPAGGETVAEPPSLGGVKRFASGRRTGDEFSEAISGSVGPVSWS